MPTIFDDAVERDRRPAPHEVVSFATHAACGEIDQRRRARVALNHLLTLAQHDRLDHDDQRAVLMYWQLTVVVRPRLPELWGRTTRVVPGAEAALATG